MVIDDRDILSHPGMDLNLKQLMKIKGDIERFNRKVSSPGYKFQNTIKPCPDALININKMIEIKTKGWK